MKTSLQIFCLLVLVIGNSFGENLGLITVEIKGIKDRPKGVLSCFIFDSREGFLQESKALQTYGAKVNSNTATCEFDIPVNKEYAIAVLDDENGNRILDKNAFGSPKEGWATSNNITHAFSAPTFDESKVLLREKLLNLSVLMHY